MQKITTFLWFDDKAEEAANFYTSLFENSRITGVTRYDEAASKAAGRPTAAPSSSPTTRDDPGRGRGRARLGQGSCPRRARTRHRSGKARLGSVDCR